MERKDPSRYNKNRGDNYSKYIVKVQPNMKFDEESIELNNKDSLARLVENVLMSVSSLAGIGVCIYDNKHFFSSRSFRGHYCGFCSIVRSLTGGREACIESDMSDAVSIGESYGKPFFHTCHIGLTELVVPVFYKQQMIATVFLGQCRLEGETKFETIASKIKNFGGDYAVFKEYFDGLPLVDRAKLLSAGTLLDLSLKHIVESSGKEVFNAYFRSYEQDYTAEAVSFIEEHYLEGITAKDVINHVHLNQSYFSRVFIKATGKSIVDYTNHVRVKRAKNLLKNTSIPIGSISINVGYSDQSYFSRVFTRLIGQSPTGYRKTMGGN